MVLNTDAVKRDYERLNSLGFFSKVEPDVKPGPDPKKPQHVTLVWHVTEQRTAQASVGFGYSGGLTGQGLYGTLGFSDSNLHGTGNSGVASVRERRAHRRRADRGFGSVSRQLAAIAEVQRRRAVLRRTIDTYYYPVYGVTSSIAEHSVDRRNAGTDPGHALSELRTQAQDRRLVATNTSSSIGASANIGRRLSDYTILSLALGAQTVRYSTTVPSPYYFQGNQPNIFVGPTPGPINSTIELVRRLLRHRRVVDRQRQHRRAVQTQHARFSACRRTRSTIPFNPRHGINAFSGGDLLAAGARLELPVHAAARWASPSSSRCSRTATLGVASRCSTPRPASSRRASSTRSPISRCADTTKCSTPPTPASGRSNCGSRSRLDRRITLAVFVDELDYRIRGAYPLLNPYTNRIVGYPGNWALVRRLRSRHPIRRTAARPAHGPHRLCERRIRNAHELRHRSEFLKSTAARKDSMNIRSISNARTLLALALAALVAPGRDRRRSHRRRLRRSGRTGELAGVRQRESRAGGV